MQTAKPKSNRRRIILASVIIAVVVGGVLAYFFVFNHSGQNQSLEYVLSVHQLPPGGNLDTPSSQWSALTNETVFLNGTSMSLVVTARVPTTSSFNDIISLNFSSPVTGVTGVWSRDTLHPAPGGTSSTELNLTAAPNVQETRLYYNFTVSATATTGSGAVVAHTTTFPLLIRSSVMKILPSSLQTAKNNSFTAEIGVTDIYSIYSFELHMKFNQTLLTADNYSLSPDFYPVGTFLLHSHGNWYNTTMSTGTSCDDPSITALGILCDGFAGQSTLDNTMGRVDLASTLIGPCVTQAPCSDAPISSGIFSLANVTFTANLATIGIGSLKITAAIVESYPAGTGIPFPLYSAVGFHSNSAISSVTVVNRTTTTSLSCTSPVVHGMASSCIATITDSSGGNLMTPTGTITFWNSTNPSSQTMVGTCSLTPVSLGVAHCTSVNFNVNTIPGTMTISGNYPGDASHNLSSGQFNITVT